MLRLTYVREKGATYENDTTLFSEGRRYNGYASFECGSGKEVLEVPTHGSGSLKLELEANTSLRERKSRAYRRAGVGAQD